MKDGRIRVLHLIDSGWPVGRGPMVVQLARAADRTKFAIGVCSLEGEGPLLDEMRQLGVEVFVLNQRGRFTPATAWKYVRHIRSGRYDILHAHIGARVPRSLAKLARCRTIAHVHGPPEVSVDRIRRNDSSLHREFKNGYGTCSDWIIANSQYVSQLLIRFCPPLASKISVIHEGLDLDQWHPMHPEQVREKKRRLGLPEDAVIIGFAGRLIPIKRPNTLMAAARELIVRYPRLHFVILGDGPLRPVLEAEAAEFGEQFRILGWQPATHWLPAVDILVQPSEIDAVPRSIMEAMACGIPVVATGVGGIPECVSHGETGFTVESGQITSTLETLLASPDMRRAMGAAGRSRCERVFDSRIMARRFEELYIRVGNPAHK